MKVYIEPYKMGSQSAKLLARALGAKRIRPEGSKFRWKPTRLVVNWGKSIIGNWAYQLTRPKQLLNKAGAVSTACDKLQTFISFTHWNTANPNDQINYPDYSTDISKAKEWSAKGYLVASRSLLRSHSGKGMVIQEDPVEAVSGIPVKLWTKYIRKSYEFRVHVFNGKVIDVEWKRRRRDSNVNEFIRSYHNGWVYTRSGLDKYPVPVEAAKVQALRAIRSLGLDFGGVDIVYSEKNKKATVLEVNTSPGLVGRTLVAYTEAIRGYLNGLSGNHNQ